MIRTLALAILLATSAGCSANQPTQPTPEPPLPAVFHEPLLTGCHIIDGKADKQCTPGALNLDVTQGTIHQTICAPGWTATVRPPVTYTNKLKRQQMPQYGETGPPSDFEEDHEIPLETGGSPTSPLNLWPEPRTGPHPAAEKDRMENAVRAAICADRITLKQGQDQLLAKWSQ